MALRLTSTAFTHEGVIPSKYTCHGGDISPPLAWWDVPANTRSLVLIVEDPDAPDPKASEMSWVHWVLFNLPPDTAGLPEGATMADLPPGTGQGLNNWNRTGYGGPCPHIGQHRYFHKIYALDTVLEGLGEPTKKTLEDAMQGHVVEQAELVGTYEESRMDTKLPGFLTLTNILLILFVIVWIIDSFETSLIPLVASFVAFISESISKGKGHYLSKKDHIQKLRDDGYTDVEGAKRLANAGRMDDAIMLYADRENINNDVKAKDMLMRIMRKDIYDCTVDELITEHRNALLRNRKRLISKDDYGVEDHSMWHAELEHFAEKVVLPMLSTKGFFSKKYMTSDLAMYDVYDTTYMVKDLDLLIEIKYFEKQLKLIDNLIKNDDIKNKPIFSEIMSPKDFEYFCSEILSQSGWHTTLTQSSGDQGVDIVAEREGIKIILQCKKYASPVGNKAVQEVIAGREYMSADGAVVVTNSTYTKSAKELARVSDVKLLHYEELSSLTADDFR